MAVDKEKEKEFEEYLRAKYGAESDSLSKELKSDEDMKKQKKIAMISDAVKDHAAGASEAINTMLYAFTGDKGVIPSARSKAESAMGQYMADSDRQAQIKQYLAKLKGKAADEFIAREDKKAKEDKEASMLAEKAKLEAEQLAYERGQDKIKNRRDEERLALDKEKAEQALVADKVKPANDTQLTTAGFAKRALSANERADAIMASGYDTGSYWRTAKDMLPDSLQGMVKSDNDTNFDQAQRDFVSAVLRKESGAAIPDSELENEKKKYFPQPGDGPQTLASKKQAREQAIANLVGIAGPKAMDAIATVGPQQATQVGASDQTVMTAGVGGGKRVVKKMFSPSRNQTKIVYSDGSEELVDGKQD